MRTYNTEQLDGHNIVLHVGYPKAGSTSLQNNLFFDNPETEYIGSNVPDSEIAKQINRLEIKQFQSLVSSKDSDGRSGDLAAQMFKQYIQPRLSHRKVNVLSEERWTTSTYEDQDSAERICARLSRLFPSAKVILVLRNQIKLLESYYNMQPYAAGDKDRIVLTPSDWIEVILGGDNTSLRESLYFSRVLAQYSDQFGRENVGCFLFETLFTESAERKRLAEFIGIDVKETVRRLDGKAANSSSRHALYNLLRRWMGGVHIGQFLPRQMVRLMLDACGRIYLPKRAVFGEDEVGLITRAYALDNRRTATMLGLDLQCQGYPLVL